MEAAEQRAAQQAAYAGLAADRVPLTQYGALCELSESSRALLTAGGMCG